jgi:DNA polymerase-3 subunit epsilon
MTHREPDVRREPVQTLLPGTEPGAGSVVREADAGAFGPTVESFGPRFAAFVAGLERPVVFFDTETTGTDPAQDRIVEISLVRVAPGATHVDPPRTWRVAPQVRIPMEASRVHGITDADVADAPTFAQLADDIAAVLHGADLAGFNVVRFDVRILQAEFARCGHPFDLSAVALFDAQVIYHRREPRTLAAALRFYRGRELHDAHGAEADTLASLEVFAGQLERYDDLALDRRGLHELSTANGDAYVDSGRRFMWRDGEPCFAFGKLRGKSLRWVAADPAERGYLRWMADGNFEEDTKAVVREALEGRIRSRAHAPAASD